jgi:MFS family permease
MGKKQLVSLFIGSLFMWTLAQGILALLPIYAVRLGADPGLIGGYLAVAFLTLTLGTVTAGWLSDKFQRRKALLMVVGLINVPATWLMGQATAFWQLVILTAIVWFFFGIGLTVISILAGMFAGEAERGKVFGILATNTSLGALIGGAVSGPIVDHYGYPALFLVATLCWAIQPLVGLFLQDKVIGGVPREAASTLPTKPALGGEFNLVLLATMLAFGAGFIAILGRPLLMDKLGFDPSQVSGAVAIGGAISLPFPLILGWLSDRVGRYGLVVLCFLTGAVGLVALAASVSLWHFWVATILLSGVGVSLGLVPALVTDLVPPESLGVALARFGAAPTIGAILGFALTGYAIQTFGMIPTFMGGALFTLIAVALVVQVQRAQVRRLAGT